MAKIIWAPSALSDFAAVLSYIAKDAPVAAKRFGENLIARTRQLKISPLSGGYIAEDENHRYRELIYGNYRIIYRASVDAKVVYVIAVHHAARLLDPTKLN